MYIFFFWNYDIIERSNSHQGLPFNHILAIHNNCCMLSQLLLYFDSLYCKHYVLWPDFSLRSSLIMVHSVYLDGKSFLECIWIYAADIISNEQYPSWWRQYNFGSSLFSVYTVCYSILHTLPGALQTVTHWSALEGAQWLSGRVLDSSRGTAGSSHTSITVLCLWARHIYPCLVLVQHRKTNPYITEKLLTGT